MRVSKKFLQLHITQPITMKMPTSRKKAHQLLHQCFFVPVLSVRLGSRLRQNFISVVVFFVVKTKSAFTNYSQQQIMSKMRKKKMDFLSSETDDDDVSDVDPEELQKMLEVCLVFILLKFNCLLMQQCLSSTIFGSLIISHIQIICQGLCQRGCPAPAECWKIMSGTHEF